MASLESLDGVAYPVELRWAQANGFAGFAPWHLLDEQGARGMRAEFRRETATDVHEIRDILPFAARQDRDDVAGFVVVDGAVADGVVEVHLTWRGTPEIEGYPGITRYDSFWDWLGACVDTTAGWCNEENLAKFFGGER